MSEEEKEKVLEEWAESGVRCSGVARLFQSKKIRRQIDVERAPEDKLKSVKWRVPGHQANQDTSGWPVISQFAV